MSESADQLSKVGDLTVSYWMYVKSRRRVVKVLPPIKSKGTKYSLYNFVAM